MVRDVFNDTFAQRENYLTAIDARIKILFVAGSLTLSLCSTAHLLPLLMAGLCSSLLLSIRTPPKIILLRLCAPLGITLVVFALQFFSYGTTPLLKCRIFGFNLIGYCEGLGRGVLTVSKVLGAVSLVIFLSMTTPFNKLLAAGRYFKISRTALEIASLTYRYIFVLLDEITTIRDAQRVRLGYKNMLRGLRSMGELAGASVIKAYDQAVAIEEAMMLRGYNEKTTAPLGACEKLTAKDSLAAAFFTLIFLLFAGLHIFFLKRG